MAKMCVHAFCSLQVHRLEKEDARRAGGQVSAALGDPKEVNCQALPPLGISRDLLLGSDDDGLANNGPDGPMREVPQ